MTPQLDRLPVLFVALALVVGTSGSVLAQPADTKVVSSSDAGAEHGVGLQLLAGTATAPFITMELPRAEGLGTALLLAARMELRPRWHVGARVPLALVGVTQPAGSYVGEAAWGNPELFVERTTSFAPAQLRAPLLARIRLAIGAPLAEHGSAGLMENRALAIADALFAWRERELFIPGQLPITPAGELTLSVGRWRVQAIAKLPVLLRVSTASPEGTTNAVGLTPVVALRARADITRRLEVSGDLGAAFDLVHPIRPIEQDARVQMSAHADLAWRIAGEVRIGATVLVPLGGPLGGDTFAAGISAAWNEAVTAP